MAKGNIAFANEHPKEIEVAPFVESPMCYDIGHTVSEMKIEGLLYEAAKNGASDIIFMQDEFVCAKIDGITHHISHRKLQEADMLIVGPILRGRQSVIGESYGNSEVNWRYVQGKRDTSLRFRANLTPCSNGYSITLRTIPQFPPSFDDINTPHHIRRRLKISKGLALVCGEVGSGKSTLLAALFKHIIQNEQQNVLTYESPIEFDLAGLPDKKSAVTQSEIPTNLATFQDAPRNSLRRAGSAILLGESRDKETFKQLSVLSETGSAVWTTIHTNSVYEALNRIISEFTEDEKPTIMASLCQTIQFILHQTLVQKPGGGRTAIIEWVAFNDEDRERMGKTPHSQIPELIKQLTLENGVLFMNDLTEKYNAGLVTEAEYLKNKSRVEDK